MFPEPPGSLTAVGRPTVDSAAGMVMGPLALTFRPCRRPFVRFPSPLAVARVPPGVPSSALFVGAVGSRFWRLSEVFSVLT